MTKYDRIGRTYTTFRRPDPRIAARISVALGFARTVVNVGAGAGSYEPNDREVTAVEPSAEMIRQRAPSAAPVIEAYAEHLPFEDGRFDAAMAILTIHHWSDKAAGLRELRRVTRGPIVLLTFDPTARPWLTDYFAGMAALDEAVMPSMSELADWLGRIEVSPVPVPHDCTDGFLHAHWRNPEAYLDPGIRSAASAFWMLGDVEQELALLSRDIASGAWRRRYGKLLNMEEYDAGYRLVVAPGDDPDWQSPS